MRRGTKVMVAICTPLAILFAGWVKGCAEDAWARERAQIEAQAEADAKFKASLSASHPRIHDAFAKFMPEEVITPKPEEVLFKYHELPADEMPIDRKEQKCLGSIIHGEAGDQTKVGKLGVGFVAQNRKDLNRPDFGGNTFCGVANFKTRDEKTKYIRWQFDGAKNPPRFITEATNEEMEIAADIIRGRVTAMGWMKLAYYFKAPYAKGGGSNWFTKAGLPYLGLAGGHGKVAGHQFYGLDESGEPKDDFVAESKPAATPVAVVTHKRHRLAAARPKVAWAHHKRAKKQVQQLQAAVSNG